MLFGIQDNELLKVEARTLKDVDLSEKDLEILVSKNIQSVIRQTELLVIAQSRKWQEEADILALDENGILYIFELKAWESRQDNLLQVMRYAQIFSEYGYDALNRMWQKFSSQSSSLSEEHTNYFGLDLPLDGSCFNKQQKLIVMTNGLDSDTRKSIQYWFSQGVKISPWVYRVYEIQNKKYIAFEAFGTTDDPYEDLPSKYHIVNTCSKDEMTPHNHMLAKKRASAFYYPWKERIKNIKKSDTVFLYQSGVGIVAYGIAKDNYKVSDWKGDKDEEYYVDLDRFKEVTPPINHSELKEIAGYHVVVASTHTTLRKESGESLIGEIRKRIRDS